MSPMRGDGIINEEMKRNLEDIPCGLDCVELGEKRKMPYRSSKGGHCLPLACRDASVSFPLLGLSTEPHDRR